MSVALAIPHTPWAPVRVESMRRLLAELELPEGVIVMAQNVPRLDVAVFQERESNKVWPRKLWGWGMGTGADHLLQLQDDTTVAPCFWPALAAMLTAVPDQVIGLSAVHPGGREIARQGHRFYRSQTVVGWAYAFPRSLLIEFLAWVDVNPERVSVRNEDDLIGDWLRVTGRHAWHPVPTLVDHDVSIASTYDNDEHSHRRATVTWRGYESGDLSSPAWWVHNGVPPILQQPAPQACWWCGTNQAEARSDIGALICRACIAALAMRAMGFNLAGAS